MWTAGEKGDGRLYSNTYSTGVLGLQEGDRFEYEIMWREPDCNCSIDFEINTEFRLRDHGPVDHNGYSPHAERNHNMSSMVYGRWYHRSWDLSGLVGKFIDKYVFSAAIAAFSKRTAFFKYIRIVDKDGKIRRAIFDDGGDPPIANAYMPGTVETACQPQTIFDSDIRLHHEVLKSGMRTVVSGEVEARTLNELSAKGNPSGTSKASLAPHHGELTRRRWDVNEDMAIHGVSIVAKHIGSDLTLWKIYERSFPEPIAPPMPLWIPFEVPDVGPLAHLFNQSKLEVELAYSITGAEKVSTVTALSKELKMV